MSIETMNQAEKIVKQLQGLIDYSQVNKQQYLEDNNTVDGYVMSLEGEITGYKIAIQLIKSNFMKG